MDLDSVTNYSTKAAILTVEHDHPPGNGLKAQVDVQLLLNTLKSTDTQIGEWINVIGYIKADQKTLPKQSKGLSSNIQVQAIILWSSGPLKLDGYERSLDMQNFDRSIIHEPH